MANKQIEFEATVSAARINALLNELRAGAEGAAKSINDAFGGTVTKRIVFDEVRDDRGVKRLVAVQKERLSVADQIINRERKLAETQKGSATSLRQQVNQLRQQRDGAARYESSVGSIGGLVRKQTDEWTSLNTKLNETARQLALAEASGFWQQLKVATRAQGLINVANGVNQVVQGLQAASIIIGQFQAAINTVVNSAAEVQSFALTFRAIGIGASGGTAALQEASRIALGLGSDLGLVQDGFRQLSPVVLNIGGSMGDVSSITETLSSRFAAFGISGDRARRVMNGVIQAFAKGKLQAEELTQQISEADPAFKTDFAKALLASKDELGKLGKEIDGSVANLEKLVKAGKITADVLLQVLPGLSKSSLLFGKLGPSAETALAALEKGNVTIDQVRANFNTLNELSLRKFAESATPLINAFLRIQAVTTDFLTRISQTQGAAAFAQLGATLFNVITSLADSFFVLVEGINTVVGVFKPLIDLLANVPGLAEGLGLLLIGNLVRPLGLFEKRIQETKTSWSNFTNSILNTLSPSRAKIKDVSEAIGTLESRLAKTFQKTGLSNPLLPIVSSTEQATNAVDNLASAATDQIDSKIDRTTRKLSELNKELQKAKVSQESIDIGQLQQTLSARIDSLQKQRNEVLTRIEQARASSGKAAQRAGIAMPTDITAPQTIEFFKKRLDDAIKELGDKLGRDITRPAIDIDQKIASAGKELMSVNMSGESAINFLGIEVRNFQKEISEALALDPASFSSVKDFEEALNTKLTSAARSIAGIGASASDIRVRPNMIGPRLNQELAAGITAKSGESYTAKIQQLEQESAKLSAEIDKTRAELEDEVKAAKDNNPEGNFSTKELKRQKKLKDQIEESQNQLQKLYAEQAKQKQLVTQVRRQQAGFDPASIASEKKQFQQLIDIEKQASQQEFLGKANARLEAIARQRTRILDQLAKIEENRARDIATFGEQAYSRGYRTDEIDRLRSSLEALDNSQNRIFTSAQKYANQQNNIGKILAEGAAEGATYEQRQLAISTALKLTNTSLQQQGKLLSDATNRLAQLKEERKALISQQAARGFTGAPQADDPIVANLTANKEEIKSTNAEISRLQDNIQEVGNMQSQLTKLQDQNTKTVNKQASGFRRLASIVVDPLVGSFRLAGSGIKLLLNGFKGLAGLIDPLTAIFLAVGVATRLYADGNKQAAEAAKKYKDQLDVLNAALKDLNPSQQETKTSSSVLSQVWQKLAIATVTLADSIGNALNSALIKIDAFLKKLAPAGDEVIRFLGIVVAGAGAGALVGSLFPGAGTAIGAVVGGIAAAFAAIATGASDADVKLQQLSKSLKETESGSALTTKVASKLSVEIIKIAKASKDANSTSYSSLQGKLELLRDTASKTKQDILTLQGTRNVGTAETGITNSKIARVRKDLKKARAELLKEQQIAGPQVKLGNVVILQFANEKIGPLERNVIRLKKELEKLEEQSRNNKGINTELDNTIKKLQNDLKIQENSVANAENAIKKAIKTNSIYLNSISKLEAAIKLLEDENKDLVLANPKNLKEFDANLEKIKRLKSLIEDVSKTDYEIKVQIREVRGKIAESQNTIDFKPGPFRDALNSVREINDSITTASETFLRDAQKYEEAVKLGLPEQGKLAALLQLSGEAFVSATREGAAKLADAGRDLQEKLKDTKSSLQDLKISKPQFFSPQELAQNANEIKAAYEEAVAKAGFRPRLEPGTPQEILAQQKEFTDTRKQADDLKDSIDQIIPSINTIATALANISGVEIETLKKKGFDVKDIIDSAKTSIDNAGAAAPRIGDVFGEISAGGKTVVLYYDNITKKTEEVTAAQFAALQQADKLAASGQNIGTGFVAGLQRIPSALTQLTSATSIAQNRVGEVLGEISGGGQSTVIYYDNIKNKIEVITKAAFDRLKAEKLVTGEAQKQANTFEQALRLFQTSNTRMARPSQPPQSRQSGGLVFLPNTLASNEGGDQQMAALGRRLGGLFVNIFNETIKKDGDGLGSFPLGKLEAIQGAVSDYRVALDAVKQSQLQLTEAQRQYNTAIGNGSKDTTTASANVINAKAALDSSNLELERATINLKDASRLAAELGVNIESVPSFGEIIGDTNQAQDALTQWDNYVNSVMNGTAKMQQRSPFDPYTQLEEGARNATVQIQESMQQWQKYVEDVRSGTQAIQTQEGAPSLEDAKRKLEEIKGLSLEQQQNQSRDIYEQFQNAAISAEKIADSILSLDGRTIEINAVTRTVPGRWSGGPVNSGQQYQVNELGKEGFLSSGGKLSQINSPANTLWRAPSSGTVIPADIWKKINAPNGKIVANSNFKNMAGISNQDEQLANIARQMNTALASSQSNAELAAIQAQQAIEIGKLGRSIEKLTAKKWNVQVNVSPRNGLSYLDGVNHRL